MKTEKNVAVGIDDTANRLDAVLANVQAARAELQDAMSKLRDREYELTQFLVENRMIDFLKANEARCRGWIRHNRQANR